MAVLAYTRYALTSSDPYTNRAPGVCLYFYCDTEAERPSGTSALNGDSAYTVDSGKRWDRTAGAWVLRTTDNLAGSLQDASGDVFPINDLADGQYLKRSGANIVSEAIAAGGDMLKSENLSGLANYATARSNMGLGSAATTASTAYATAAQGATADTALQSIANGSITLAKQADVATATVFYRKTAATGVPEVQTLATLKTDLLLTGTNSGDQTSIVGITGTIAQFNTALSDGDFATGGGTATGTNTGDNATNSQYSGLAASKQDTLVSATNIKTVNGSTLLGSGNLAVSASDPSYTPGSFTIATGTGRMIVKRMQLSTTERATLAGTARLRLT